MRLDGRAILVTGASRGLGKAIAAACVREGASVFLTARDGDLLEQARREISAAAAMEAGANAGDAVTAPAGATGGGAATCPAGARVASATRGAAGANARDPTTSLGEAAAAESAGAAAPAKVLAFPADISHPDQARRLVEAFRNAFPRVHGLVNNAGILGPVGKLEEAGWERWTEAIHTNLVGPARLCALLIPMFRRNGYGKIVNISGGGATAPRPRFSAYAASKAALVRLTETLAEETAGSGIDINAIAPGSMNTRLLDEVIETGPERVGEQAYSQAVKQKAEGGAPFERAAALSVFLLSAESDGITGRLISALWDAWERLPDRRETLRGTDVYTLRRIIPSDRGFDW